MSDFPSPETIRAALNEILPTVQKPSRYLGLERLEYSDLSCPLIDTPPLRYTTEQARQLVTESLTPLGQTYGSTLAQAFRSRCA